MNDAYLVANDRQIRKVLARFGTIELEGPLHRRPNASIYRAYLREEKTSFAVKCCTGAETMRGASYAVERQYRDLKSAYERMAGIPECGVPKPILHAPEENILVLEWIDGTCLNEYRRRRDKRSELPNLIWRAGRWLANFHSAGPHETTEFNTQAYLDELRDLIQPQTSGILGFLLEKNLKFLCSHVNYADGVYVVKTIIHGDYQLGNLILDNSSTLYSIDYSFSRTDYNIIDIINFFSHLDRQSFSPRYFQFRQDVPLFYDSFIKGYESVMSTPNKKFILWLLLSEQTRYFARIKFHRKRVIKRLYYLVTFIIITFRYRSSIKKWEKSNETDE